MSIESFFCLREQPPRHNPESVADAGQAFRRIKLSSSSTVVVTRDLLEVDDALCNAQGGRELELSWLTPLCLWCTFISFEIQMMILMLPSQFRSDGDDGRCLESNGVCRCRQPDLSPRAILFRPVGSAYFPAANKAKASASGGDKKFCRSRQPIQLELRCRHHPSHCLRGLRDWCPAWPSQLSWWQSSDRKIFWKTPRRPLEEHGY